MHSPGFESSARSPPFWSWVSFSGVIYSQPKELRSFSTIVGHDCVTANGEEFRTKAAKEITIEGPLEAWQPEARWKFPECSLGTGFVECSFGTGLEWGMYLEFCLILDRSTTVKESIFFLLRLAEDPPSRGSSTTTNCFLLLERLEDPSQRSSAQRQARYRRLSLLTLSRYEMDKNCGLGQTIFTKTEQITVV